MNTYALVGIMTTFPIRCGSTLHVKGILRTMRQPRELYRSCLIDVFQDLRGHGFHHRDTPWNDHAHVVAWRSIPDDMQL
jgi:hypothetical protein